MFGITGSSPLEHLCPLLVLLLPAYVAAGAITTSEYTFALNHFIVLVCDCTHLYCLYFCKAVRFFIFYAVKSMKQCYSINTLFAEYDFLYYSKLYCV